MIYPVIDRQSPIGECRIAEEGLYWQLDCRCRFRSPKVERLYAGSESLGVLEQVGEELVLTRRISRRSAPMLPPKSGVLRLEPEQERAPWRGRVLEYDLEAVREGDTLLFPYAEDRPCPCEPLLCFFRVEDGFWKLPLQPDWPVTERA